ncbi:MAG TPA: FG-GAP-like repeat-containing protein [Phycisphaerae bacterium]
MLRATITKSTVVLSFVFPAALFGQGWVTFTNQTSTRISAAANLSTTDPEEKDYAWGDFDHDGDTDLVCVRKQPNTTLGGRRNVLFMNVNGVLTDQTNQYAIAANDGGQGFLDLTNDRDVVATDVNNDGWLDIVTQPALAQGQPKTMSHPRVYLNLGNDANGVWQGFFYDEPRIPQILPGPPNGCGIAAGDVTGDGFADLYIVDYDSVQTSPVEDILLINDGTGHFTNQTNTRLTPAMTESGFGTSCWIQDMNNDGWNDIVKNGAGDTRVIINGGSGFFTQQQTVYGGSSYFVSTGDLNNDGKIDLVISDDGADRYLLNTTTASGGLTTFMNNTFSFQSGGDDGFGSSSRMVDLNNDGWKDVLISDVDVDIPGCGRRLHIYRNLGNAPNVTIQEQGTAGIPVTSLTGDYDVAPIDIDGDGWKDLVLGRCSGMSVWMNQPPVGLTFSYPQGLPAFVTANPPLTFQVQLNPIGGTVQPGSAMFFVATLGSPFTGTAMQEVGPNLYSATFPSGTCTQRFKFYVSAQISGGGTFTDPAGAPTNNYVAVVADGSLIALHEEFEGNVSSWTVVNAPSLTGGAWEQAHPNGTIFSGAMAAPNSDASQAIDGQCFVTQNGPPGAAAGSYDVDGGPTYLLSPVIDLSGADASISYARWFFCSDAGNPTTADFLRIEVSNDGGNAWSLVENVAGTGSAWQSASFLVSNFTTPTANVRVRFSTSDASASVTEAGIDNFQVEKFVCNLPGDLNHDAHIDLTDHALFTGCLTGPGGGVPADCAGADLQADNDVDLGDFAQFESGFTG